MWQAALRAQLAGLAAVRVRGRAAVRLQAAVRGSGARRLRTQSIPWRIIAWHATA